MSEVKTKKVVLSIHDKKIPLYLNSCYNQRLRENALEGCRAKLTLQKGNKWQKQHFGTLLKITIEKVGTPLSAKEIWDKANALGTLGDFSTTGKTPWASISAYCYTDINANGDSSTIIQTSERPAQFFLRRLSTQIDYEKVQRQKENEIAKKVSLETKKFTERDLHSLLVAYAFADSHFKANLKTVFHENSMSFLAALRMPCTPCSDLLNPRLEAL